MLSPFRSQHADSKQIWRRGWRAFLLTILKPGGIGHTSSDALLWAHGVHDIIATFLFLVKPCEMEEVALLSSWPIV